MADSPRQTIKFAIVTIANTATALTALNTQSVCVKVPAGGSTVFLGDSTVTAITGFPVAAGEAFCDDIDLSKGQLFGIVAAGTQDVHLLGSN